MAIPAHSEMFIHMILMSHKAAITVLKDLYGLQV